MAKRNQFQMDGKVEVVMKKITSYDDYLKMIQSARKKGWKIQAYEIDFYNDNLKQQNLIENENNESKN